MKHFYLIVNKEKENAEKGAEMIAEYLSRQGCECLWDQEPPDTSEYRYDGRPEGSPGDGMRNCSGRGRNADPGIEGSGR